MQQSHRHALSSTSSVLTLTGHLVHAVATEAPRLRLKVPAGQGMALMVLVLGQYAPAGQGCRRQKGKGRQSLSKVYPVHQAPRAQWRRALSPGLQGQLRMSHVRHAYM